MPTILSQRLCRSGSVLLIVLVTWTAWTVRTQAEEVDEAFYQRNKEGWFWYHDPEPQPESEETLKNDMPPAPAANKYRNAPLEEYSIEDLWKMYPEDFQQLLNHVQNLAVQEPTEKNVLRYLTMQDVARRKALAYTNTSMYVTQKYGKLFDVSQVYPTAKPGVTARVQMEQQEVGDTIAGARDSHAMIFFYSPTCGFCEKQRDILLYFVQKYGWTIKSVNISSQPDIAARFDIETTPTLLLIKKGMDEYMTVSVGVVALTELERKLYRAIRYLSGKTRDDNFLIYDFQEGSVLDPASILHKVEDQKW